VGIFQRIYREGLGAIWEIIKEKFTDFKDMIWEAIKTFIRDAVIRAAITFLLSLLNPIAAFVKACMAIYDFLMMLVKMKDRIIDLLNSILDAVITIATGSIDAAAAAIEKAFAKSIPIIIGFLAALLHLNNIGDKVRDIILRIRAKVDKLIDWLIGKAYSVVGPVVEAAMHVKNKGKQLIEKGKEKIMQVGSSAAGAVAGWLGLRKQFKAEDNESHELYIDGTEDNAELMVASNPIKFRELIAGIDTQNDPRRTAAKNEALPLARALDKLLKTNIQRGLTQEEQRVQRKLKSMEVQSALDRLAPYVAILMATENVPTGGSKAQAIPMTWYKPREEYPRTVTLEDKRRGLVTTAFGKTNTIEPDIESLSTRNDDDARFIKRKYPIGSVIEIGVINSYIPGMNTYLVKNRSYRAALRTEPQQTFRAICIVFGYDMRQHGEDADHVTDLQFEGFDDLSNLWPLKASVNRSSLNFLNQVVTYRDNNGVVRAVPLYHESLLGKHFKITAIQLF